MGISSDIKAGKRRDILDYILLHDDLSDITDLTYKTEWGRANTELRLKKMVDSLVMFAKNAKKQERNYDLAIKSWEEDLRYIEYTHGTALGSLDDHYIEGAIYSIAKLSSE